MIIFGTLWDEIRSFRVCMHVVGLTWWSSGLMGLLVGMTGGLGLVGGVVGSPSVLMMLRLRISVFTLLNFLLNKASMVLLGLRPFVYLFFDSNKCALLSMSILGLLLRLICFADFGSSRLSIMMLFLLVFLLVLGLSRSVFRLAGLLLPPGPIWCSDGVWLVSFGGVDGLSSLLNKAVMAHVLMLGSTRLAFVGFAPVCCSGVVLEWSLVRGSLVSLLICLFGFWVCWMFDCWDRSPRCKRFFSAGGMLYLRAFHFPLLRPCGVSTRSSCLLVAQVSQWPLGVVCLEDGVDGELRAQSIATQWRAFASKCCYQLAVVLVLVSCYVIITSDSRSRVLMLFYFVFSLIVSVKGRFTNSPCMRV